VEHGAGSDDDGESEEHGGSSRRITTVGAKSDWDQMATVDAMKIANKEMKKQYKGIDIDKIEVSFDLRGRRYF
jgi:hypothetical protein